MSPVVARLASYGVPGDGCSNLLKSSPLVARVYISHWSEVSPDGPPDPSCSIEALLGGFRLHREGLHRQFRVLTVRQPFRGIPSFIPLWMIAWSVISP